MSDTNIFFVGDFDRVVIVHGKIDVTEDDDVIDRIIGPMTTASSGTARQRITVIEHFQSGNDGSGF